MTSMTVEAPCRDLSSENESHTDAAHMDILRGLEAFQVLENGLEETPLKGEGEGVAGCTSDNGVEVELIRITKHVGWENGTKRRIYSRSELEAVRFMDVKGQKRRWKELYGSMQGKALHEYNRLRLLNRQQYNKRPGNLQRLMFMVKDDFETVATNLDVVFSLNNEKDLGIFTLGASYEEDLTCDQNWMYIDESYSENNNIDEQEEYEDDDSDEEYDSFQRPAFLVEGEPDFDSGPPLDGLEYLRRVRWESKQIPKVKVSQLNLKTLKGEQTPYIPNIPKIAECPLNLLPSKVWAESFLADFLKLRQAFSELEDSEILSLCPAKPNGDPKVGAILVMDPASRASMLRKSIDSFEAASPLSRADCLWLYALCATVDAPVNPDTCASLRELLRKCSSLLATKSELDDEVAMLSILTIITGKFFGQSENR